VLIFGRQILIFPSVSIRVCFAILFSFGYTSISLSFSSSNGDRSRGGLEVKFEYVYRSVFLLSTTLLAFHLTRETAHVKHTQNKHHHQFENQ
jgi:hypothetical protein